MTRRSPEGAFGAGDVIPRITRLEALATAVGGYFSACMSTSALRELYAAHEAVSGTVPQGHPIDHGEASAVIADDASDLR